ncbi:MAG: cardiolipin synthase [Ottowia sp.]|uniref:cardiolipin synthase n=1 Tax=Ottowia sp. TaxID=1898956 RepID=UPI0039E4CB0C
MAVFSLLLHPLLVLVFGAAVLLRDDLAPDVRMAWIVVIVLLPYAGCGLYHLFGRANIGRAVLGRYRRVRDLVREQVAEGGAAARVLGAPRDVAALIAPPWQGAARYAASVNGFQPVPGNQGELMAGGAEARARMLADMDAAEREISVLYYIWLDDGTGTAVAEALMRAARRGVACRAMVDGLGSRALLRGPLWRRMREAGVQLAVALPIRHPLKVMLTSRIDLRNHRKITLIDGRVTYVGSQNCADEAFLVKAKYAPWVDIMLRLRGPVVAQMQLLFATDWMQATDERLDVVAEPAESLPNGFAAQVVGEGPTERRRATPQLVSTLIANAREQVTISTPYFVPDATVLEALCTAAWRGVRVTMIFPARNDSWIVAAASRSTYPRLLAAGVRIHEYRGGLLHAKTLTVDGLVTFIGSTNLDRRSFDLNFENNVLLQDAALTAAVMARQAGYIARAEPVALEAVRRWSRPRRMWNNALATLGPVL